MAKIVRKVAKIFGSSAGLDEIAEFGSLAAGSPTFTTDPAVIQSLSQYLSGWFAGVLGGNSPAIEDMNALCFLFAYQIAYIMQSGIPEWDSATTYYKGSLASDGISAFYISLVDNNTNNALTDTTKWHNVTANPGNVITSAAGTTILDSTSDEFQTVIGSTTQIIQLPDSSTLALGWRFNISNFSTGEVTVNLHDGTFRINVPSNQTVVLTLTA